MTELVQRQPREREPKFLAFVRTKPCAACGKPGRSDAAHIRLASKKYNKRYCGFGEKPDDKYCTPLCRSCHRKQHSGSEQLFWYTRGKNPLAIAAELYRIFKLQGDSQPTTKRPTRRARIPARTNPWPKGRKLQSRNSFSKGRRQLHG